MSQLIRSPFLVAAILAVLAFGCNSEQSEITGPGTGSITRINLLLISPFGNSLQKARLTLDGRDLLEFTSVGSAAPSIPFDATVSGLSRGEHVLRIVIVEQATSPSLYIAAGAITTPDRIIEVRPVEGNLATGQALEIRWNL